MASAFKIDTSKFNAMCHQMASLTGGKFADVLAYEVAKVMEKAMKLTPAASVGKIREYHDYAEFSAQPDTLYTPVSAAGRTARARARRIKGNLLLYNLANRYPDELWAAITEARGLALKKAIAARGLSKRTWLQLAAQMGFEISAAGFIKKAIPSKPVPESVYLSGMRVRRTTSRSSAVIYIANAQPTINRIGGAGILQRAINSRLSYFHRNLFHHVFEAAAKIAKRYPGIRVST